MKKLKILKPKKLSAGERLTAVENSVVTAMSAFAEFKQMLGTKAVEALTERAAQLEKLFKPEMERLLGELRAVRNLLDEKGQYAHMDKPRPELSTPPSLSEGSGP